MRLKELKGRFERSGMEDIRFFVINAIATTLIEEVEIEIEEETWKAISPGEAEGFPVVETSLNSLINTLGSEIQFIQDNSEFQIWNKLHASRDQILIIDGSVFNYYCYFYQYFHFILKIIINLITN